MKFASCALALCACILAVSRRARACTQVDFTCSDGTAFVAHGLQSMTGAGDLIVHPRGEHFSVPGIPGHDWGLNYTTKVGFVAAHGRTDWAANIDVLDGVNEHGLAVNVMLMVGYVGRYEDAPGAESDKALHYSLVAPWILGNFRDVASLNESLAQKEVIITALPWLQPSGKPLSEVHWGVVDATGRSLVIEVVDGQLNVYDNAAGVLTNAPPFPWHLMNLQNFLSLYTGYPKFQIGVAQPFSTFSPVGTIPRHTGAGYGLRGLPGDPTPPSRFVRLYYEKAFAGPPKDAASGFALANALLNSVFVPYGTIRDPKLEITVWEIVKDLTSNLLYYRSYYDMQWKIIDVKKLNFTEGAAKAKLNMVNSQPQFVDRTQDLRI